MNENILIDQLTVKITTIDNNCHLKSSNHSFFDEKSSVFVTERSLALGRHLLTDKVLFEVLQDHVTIVKDYHRLQTLETIA